MQNAINCDDKPFFSIIIPTFNSASTINKCIKSVLHQTFKNFEIIVQDGCFSDSIIKLVNEISDNRVRVYSKKDNGVYDAMNKAMTRSIGRWLYFLGADDYLFDENVLKDVVEFIKLNDADLIYGNVFSPDNGEAYDGEFDYDKIVKKNICHQAIFYNRNVFIKKGPYNIKYRVFGDWDFNLRCFLDATIHKIHFPRTIAFYAPGGLSVRTPDHLFRRNFYRLVIKYGKEILPKKIIKQYRQKRFDYSLMRLKYKLVLLRDHVIRKNSGQNKKLIS